MIESNRLLSIAVFLISTVVSVKVADLVVAHFYPNAKIGQFNTGQIKPTERVIVLRERSPGIDTYVRASPGLLAGTQNLERKFSRFRTDDDGFIVGSNGSSKSVDILFLGGSTTECFYVDEALRFPYLVSQILKDAKGGSIRTLNAGVSGNHSMHNLFVLMAKGIKYHPKLVVLMNNINDLSLLSKTGSYWTAPQSRSFVIGQSDKVDSAADGWIYNILREIKNVLMPSLWELARITFAKDRTDKDEWSDMRNMQVPDLKKLPGEFRSSILSFVYLVRAWGGQPVLMTQFNRLKAGDEFVRHQYEHSHPNIPYSDFIRLYAEFNQIIRDVGKAQNVPVIDLDREVPSSSKYLYDAVHLNDTGSRYVAGIVATSLSKSFPGFFAMPAAAGRP